MLLSILYNCDDTTTGPSDPAKKDLLGLWIEADTGVGSESWDFKNDTIILTNEKKSHDEIIFMTRQIKQK